MQRFSLSLFLVLLLLSINENAARDNGNLIAMPVDKSTNLIPESIDWRVHGAVTPVKDRKNCQSGSWAFATAEAIEAINKIATGNLVELSAQQLLDCSASNGCNSGFPQQAFKYLMDTGLASAADYQFTGFSGSCKKNNRYSVFIDDFYSLDGSSDERKLLEIVAKQPVIAMIDGSAPEFINYKGGIYKGPCRNDQASPNLSVLIVGYGSENGEDYWIIKNSAGRNWGEQGYMKMQRGDHSLPLGRCGVNGLVYYPRKEKVAKDCHFPCRPFSIPCCPPGKDPECCLFGTTCGENGCTAI